MAFVGPTFVENKFHPNNHRFFYIESDDFKCECGFVCEEHENLVKHLLRQHQRVKEEEIDFDPTYLSKRWPDIWKIFCEARDKREHFICKPLIGDNKIAVRVKYGHPLASLILNGYELTPQKLSENVSERYEVSLSDDVFTPVDIYAVKNFTTETDDDEPREKDAKSSEAPSQEQNNAVALEENGTVIRSNKRYPLRSLSQANPGLQSNQAKEDKNFTSGETPKKPDKLVESETRKNRENTTADDQPPPQREKLADEPASKRRRRSVKDHSGQGLTAPKFPEKSSEASKSQENIHSELRICQAESQEPVKIIFDNEKVEQDRRGFDARQVIREPVFNRVQHAHPIRPCVQQHLGPQNLVPVTIKKLSFDEQPKKKQPPSVIVKEEQRVPECRTPTRTRDRRFQWEDQLRTPPAQLRLPPPASQVNFYGYEPEDIFISNTQSGAYPRPIRAYTPYHPHH